MAARLICTLALLLWAARAGAFDQTHAAWNALLSRHVAVMHGGEASRLSYAGMAADKARLDDYLDSLSAVKEAEFAGWSRAEQMAFLINAYNAFTVAKVLSRYPGLASIRDFGRVFGNPFRDEFFLLLGHRASLDWIEQENLRPRYREPRVHFALNCASVGCPMLREEAYLAAKLDGQLASQEARFLADRSRNRVRDARLEVSRIFDWYGKDFAPLERYFAGRADALSALPAERDAIRAGRMPVSFLEYDWSLNDAK